MYKEDLKFSSIDNFLEFVLKLKKESGWVFRGQNEYNWPLKSSLERALENFNIPLNNGLKLEQGLIRKFKRQYSNYSTTIPIDNDYVEWLSIMQHHGCPTRMVDFSYSPYIALFFAIIDSKIDTDSAIWCINVEWLNKFKYEEEIASQEYLNELADDKERKYKKLHKIILNNKQPYLYSITPFYLNIRLNIQQGVFIIPTDITKSYMENLKAVQSKNSNNNKIMKIRINCNSSFMKEAYNYLNSVNINSSTLFPGLDGYSQYLKMLLMFPSHIYSEIDEFI